MAVKYGEFKFPSDKGFTGSAGKTMVKAYARGGCVMKAEGGSVRQPGKRRIVEGGMKDVPVMTPEQRRMAREAETPEERRERTAPFTPEQLQDYQRRMKTGGKVHEDEAMDRALLKKMVKPAAMKAKGGKVHEDEAEDKKLIERMVKPAARKARGGRACG